MSHKQLVAISAIGAVSVAVICGIVTVIHFVVDTMGIVVPKLVDTVLENGSD